jgi:hypothetical protein
LGKPEFKYEAMAGQAIAEARRIESEYYREKVFSFFLDPLGKGRSFKSKCPVAKHE